MDGQATYIELVLVSEDPKINKAKEGIAEWSRNMDSDIQKHIHAINHKFETWKMIMSEEMLFEKELDGKLVKLKASLPNTLFYGDKAHDLGQILMSEGSEAVNENESTLNNQ